MVLDMKWMESKPLPMLIEDHTVFGIVDRGLNSTSHKPEVGGNQNR